MTSRKRRSVCYHSAEGNGARGVVVNGDEVDEESSGANNGWDESRGEHHLPDPLFAAHSRVYGAAEVAVHWRRGGVHEDGGA